jgi:hypothetical protein
MTFDQLLNERITIKRNYEIGRGSLNQPIMNTTTIGENIKCTMKRASARSIRDVWGENLNVDYEARMTFSDIQEGDIIEWSLYHMKVIAIREDTRHHHLRVAMEVLQ